MSAHTAGFQLVALLVGIVIGLLGASIMMSGRPHVRALYAPCVVDYGINQYRIEPGETCLGVCPGDPTNCARVRNVAGLVRFQRPEPKSLDQQP